MTPDTIDESQRRAARVVGFTFVFELTMGLWLLFKPLRPYRMPAAQS